MINNILFFVLSILVAIYIGYHNINVKKNSIIMPLMDSNKLYRVYKDNLIELTTKNPIVLINGICNEKYKPYYIRYEDVINISDANIMHEISSIYFFKDKTIAKNDGIIYLNGVMFDLKFNKHLWNYYEDNMETMNMFKVITNYTINNTIYFHETDYDCRYFNFNPIMRIMTYSKNISYGIKSDYEICRRTKNIYDDTMCIFYQTEHPKNMTIYTNNNDIVYEYINDVYGNICLDVLDKKYIINADGKCPKIIF